MRLFYLFLIVGLLLTSCFRDVHSTLQQGLWTGAYNYEIKSMAGCCGCKALYFNVYTNHILTEQFVVETACGLFEPTKHVFKTGSKGEVLSYKSFVAVTDSTYTIPLTKLEKDAFKKLDSIYSSSWHAANRKIVFANISGFKDGGEPHFPVGVKMSKQLKYSR